MGYIDIMPYSLEHNGLPSIRTISQDNSTTKKIRKSLALEPLSNRQARLDTTSHLDRTSDSTVVQFSTGGKFNVSALPSPDSTPTIIRIPTPSSESSLLSPPLDIDINNLDISEATDSNEERRILPPLCSPDFPRAIPGSPGSLPSLDVVMAYTRDRTDVPLPQSLPQSLPLQRGRWLWVNQQNVQGSHRPQVQQYMRERPREWGRLNQLAVEASRRQREQEEEERRTEIAQAAAAAALASTPRQARISRPRQQSIRSRDMSKRPVEERSAPSSNARRPRKRSLPEDNQTTPKRKKAAPSENKVKYDTWQQIAHWFGIFPEISQSQGSRDYVTAHRNQLFAGFQPGGTLTEPKRMSRKDPNIHLLCEFEIEFCERLGWDTNKFLIHKLRLFHANFMELKKNPGKPFNKTRAQQSGQCDVNNMSRFFEVYSYTGLLSNSFIQESVAKSWNEDAAAATLKKIGIATLEDAATTPATLKDLRESNRGNAKGSVDPSLKSPPATGTNNSPVSVLGSTTTSPEDKAGSTNTTPSIRTRVDSNSPVSSKNNQETAPSSFETFPNQGQPSIAGPIYTGAETPASQSRDLF
jgi:hypothetical protein